jgi:hypothetical protein
MLVAVPVQVPAALGNHLIVCWIERTRLSCDRRSIKENGARMGSLQPDGQGKICEIPALNQTQIRVQTNNQP